MKTLVTRIIPFFVLLSIALSASQCDADEYDPSSVPFHGAYSEADIAIMLQLENDAHKTEKIDIIQSNNCREYEQPVNKEESFEFREDRLIVTSGSEKRYFVRKAPGMYCWYSKDVHECITELKEDSYQITVYQKERGFMGRPSWKSCYDAIKLISMVENSSIEEETINPGLAEEDEDLSEQENPEPESLSDPNAENPEEETADEPPASEESSESTSPLIFHDWYGPACEEMEGTFPYFWEIHLVENPETGGVNGTIKYHNCPGGGRVLYTVSGTQNDEGLFLLQGTKKTGGGALYNDSSDTRTFTFDPTSGSFSE